MQQIYKDEINIINNYQTELEKQWKDEQELFLLELYKKQEKETLYIEPTNLYTEEDKLLDTYISTLNIPKYIKQILFPSGFLQYNKGYLRQDCAGKHIVSLEEKTQLSSIDCKYIVIIETIIDYINYKITMIFSGESDSDSMYVCIYSIYSTKNANRLIEYDIVPKKPGYSYNPITNTFSKIQNDGGNISKRKYKKKK